MTATLLLGVITAFQARSLSVQESATQLQILFEEQTQNRKDVRTLARKGTVNQHTSCVPSITLHSNYHCLCRR